MKNLIFLTLASLTFLLSGCKSEQVQVMETEQANKVSDQQIKESQQSINERQQKQAIELAEAEQAIAYKNNTVWIWSLGTLILVVGLSATIVLFSIQAAFYGGQYIKTRSQLVYAGNDGQMPLVITRGHGYQIINDPNLQIATSNAIQLPTPREQVAGLLNGRKAEVKLITAPETPLQLKAATQAQSVRLMRAAVSGSDMDRIERRNARKLAENKVSEELRNPMDNVITAEIRTPRDFQLIDKTGTITL